ncbi:MAG: hypothetical protein JSS28_04100, partial [Proteobacteria bacterium]|nr:hypothetical protein [Pseudomonadota bacterium]
RGYSVRQVAGPLGSRVSWLSFSEDDAWLAAARSDGTAIVYDVATGSQLHAGQMQSGFDATHVDIDHRSHLLVLSGQIAGGTGDAQIWHIPQESPMLGTPTSLISSPPRDGRAGLYWLSAAPRAGLLASASMDGEIRLWRLPKAIVLDARPPLLVSNNLYADGDHVVDVDHDRLRVVSTAQGAVTPWLPLPPPIAFAQLVDASKTLVVVARTGLHVLDAATLKPRIPAIALDNTPQRMVVSADGRFAVLSFNHNGSKGLAERIERYDLVSGKRTDRGEVAIKAPLRQLQLSDDASRLFAIGPVDGATQVFDATTLQLLFAYPHDPSQPVMSAAFSRGARYLWMVTRNTDDTQADNADLIRVDLHTAHIVETRHVTGVYPVGIAVVGDKPLLAGRDRLVLDPGAADEHAVTGLHGGEATTIFAISRDGRLVAHAFGAGVQLYFATDLTPIGPPLPTQTGTLNNVSNLAFSDDGRHLLAEIDPPLISHWTQWPVAISDSHLDELRADAALLEPRDAGPRVLAMADAIERHRLRSSDPGPPRALQPQPEFAVERWIGADPIPARDPAAGPLQIDLGGVYNRAPRSTMNVMNTVLPAMNDTPFGLPRLDGVDYDWRGELEMRQDGGDLRVGVKYHFTPRTIVRGLHVPPVPIAAFHVLLYAPETIGESSERVYVNVRLHYRDGSQAVLPLRTQREVKGWTDHDRPTPVGWTQGEVSHVLGLVQQITFNNPRLPNPHPDKIVQTLDLETVKQQWSTPVFCAITAEPVIAGRSSRMNPKGMTANAPARDKAKP